MNISRRYQSILLILVSSYLGINTAFSQTSFELSTQGATNGGCNGEITVFSTPENLNLTYVWSNGEETNSPTLNQLCPGLYSVAISLEGDTLNGCGWELSVFLNGEGGCYIDTEVWNPVFNNVQMNCEPPLQGRMEVNPSSNVEYLYLWNTGGTSNFLETEIPGEYYVEIKNPLFPDCSKKVEFILEDESCSDECLLIEEVFDIDIIDFKPSCVPIQYGQITINSTNLECLYSWSTESNNNGITIGQEGNYSVTITDANDSSCDTVFTFHMQKKPCKLKETKKRISQIHYGPIVIINEVSWGQNNYDEYVEILVLGDNTCNPVDLRGFIIDDNNGVFSNAEGVNNYGVGISNGHLKFKNDPHWSFVPVGSIILIYNENNKNINIPQDDYKDGNDDKVYILPASMMLASESTPTFLTESYTPIFDDFLDGSWSNILLNNERDGIQIRNQLGEFIHGLSYDNSNKMNGGPINITLKIYDYSEPVISLNEFNYLNEDSYSVGLIDGEFNSFSPGEPNSNTNKQFIENVKCKENEFTNLDVHIYPNPFSNNLNIDFNFDENKDISVDILDVLGKVKYTQNFKAIHGANQFNLTLNSLLNGVYYVKLRSNDELLHYEKVLKIR